MLRGRRRTDAEYSAVSVLFVTSLGELVIGLYPNQCPLKLSKIKYYNGCLFHTVLKDFIAQTGDPAGTGTAGDSVYKFFNGYHARFFAKRRKERSVWQVQGRILMGRSFIDNA